MRMRRIPMNFKTKKIMVVCADFNDELETHLVCHGWTVIWVYDGKSAIAKARCDRFELVLLISTGDEIDTTETYLNLKDIREAMPIVVMIENAEEKNPAAKPSFFLPDAKVLAAKDFGRFLESVEGIDGNRSARSTGA